MTRGSSTSKTRVAIIGTGFGERVLLPAFRELPGVEVAGLCATKEANVRRLARKHGIIAAYHDWRNLLHDPQIEAVVIATPPAVQPEIAIAALQAGKHVFCEKPLALSAAVAAKMASAARSSRLAAMVDFEFPEIGVWRKAKEILDSGGIGRPRQVAVRWHIETRAARVDANSWKTRMSEGGGSLFPFVSHIFYYLEWLFGPIEALACGLFPPSLNPCDTGAILELEFARGLSTAVSVNLAAVHGSGHSLEIYGDCGTMVLQNQTRDYITGFRLLQGLRGDYALRFLGKPERATNTDGRIAAVRSVAKKFLEWMHSGKPQTPSFHQGLRVQQLLDKALLSHRSGKKIKCLPKGH